MENVIFGVKINCPVLQGGAIKKSVAQGALALFFRLKLQTVHIELISAKTCHQKPFLGCFSMVSV